MKIFGMGGLELVIILVVILLIFGPKNLPKLGSALGKTVSNLREGMGAGKKKDKKGENAAAAEGDEAAAGEGTVKAQLEGVTEFADGEPVAEDEEIVEEVIPASGPGEKPRKVRRVVKKRAASPAAAEEPEPHEA